MDAICVATVISTLEICGLNFVKFEDVSSGNHTYSIFTDIPLFTPTLYTLHNKYIMLQLYQLLWILNPRQVQLLLMPLLVALQWIFTSLISFVHHILACSN